MADFLVKLYLLGKISWRDRDIELGKYFGYPKCCINFYVLLQSLNVPASIVLNAIFGIDALKYNYVRCPKCRGFDNVTPSTPNELLTLYGKRQYSIEY